MSYLGREPGARRLPAALGVGALHGVLGAVLLAGLAVNIAPAPPPAPIVVRLDPLKPMPPEKPVEPTFQAHEVVIRVLPPEVTYAEPAPEPTPTPGPGPEAGPSAGPERAGPVLPPVAPVRVAAKARPGLVGVGPDDYPLVSRRLGEEGRTRLVVGIAADGTVRDCRVTASSGHPRLDARACEVALRRWRFTPATADGVAVPSTAERTISWRLADLR
jgi:protein TonB